MKSTPESIREAQRTLAQFMASERQCTQSARVDAGASFTIEDDAQHGPDAPERVKARAQEYAKARNLNLRPSRQIDETDKNARDGKDSALAFLEKRRRSVIRK